MAARPAPEARQEAENGHLLESNTHDEMWRGGLWELVVNDVNETAVKSSD